MFPIVGDVPANFHIRFFFENFHDDVNSSIPRYVFLFKGRRFTREDEFIRRQRIVEITRRRVVIINVECGSIRIATTAGTLTFIRRR